MCSTEHARSLGYNQLCRIGDRGRGTYTAEAITKIADMLAVNTTLQSIRYSDCTCSLSKSVSSL